MVGKQFTLTEYAVQNDRKTVLFRYHLTTDEREYQLEESLSLPEKLTDSYEVHALLRGLHIALSLSYYKTFVPPEIDHPYAMSNSEADFWNQVFVHGLGEFLYKNQLSHDVIATLAAQEGDIIRGNKRDAWQNDALLGIGGGKDSIVAGELMKAIGITPKGFVLATGEQLGQTKAVADVMGVDLLAVNRQLDQQIIGMNQTPGAYNGHVPISIVFALVGALLAVNNGNRYVVVANEASASLPQTTWNGEQINHQWSKSLESELLLQKYLRSHVSPELHYFSALRPLSSVAIAKIFAHFPEYFEVFTSDNSLFKINQAERDHPRWSLTSPKSLSSYVLLAAWLDQPTLLQIFGRDYLNEASLSELFDGMLGVGEQRVLDCVGTPEELRLSLAMAKQKGIGDNSVLMQRAVENGVLQNVGRLDDFMGTHLHALPDSLKAPMLGKLKEWVHG